MDIHMPVMDGMEASAKITAMGIKTPIVAITANIMANDLELYKASGISDFIGKPFTSHELWECLLRYLSPMNISTIDKASQDSDNEKMQRLLVESFVKNNKETYSEFKKALDAGNIELAYRLVHTLKANAGQIGEKRLQEIAANTESILKEGKNKLTEEQNGILEAELKSVLEKLKYAEVEAPRETLDAKKIREVFEKLDVMLSNRNPECMNLLSDIRSIPGTEELARLVGDFEFKRAIATLSKLRKELG
jgi:CheY-like chemotaxis protein